MQTPEEIELERKRRLLERISDRLADREEEMADLRGELERFEARYTMNVARLYAEFDEIEALIAEEEYKLVPDDEEIKRRAEELRRRAEESAARLAEDAERTAERAEPTIEAKKAYHQLARAIHPDLAVGADEKERRHALMAELNQAYSSGDQTRLDAMVAGLRVSPDVITGDSVGDHLIRVIRQIYQARHRIRELAAERSDIESSELFELKLKYESEMAEGRDMLAQMAARTSVHIKKSERRLQHLRNVNLAAEQHVKETYGMDIDEFRKT